MCSPAVIPLIMTATASAAQYAQDQSRAKRTAKLHNDNLKANYGAVHKRQVQTTKAAATANL